MRVRLRLLPIVIFSATCLLSIKVIDISDGLFRHVPTLGVGATMAAGNPDEDMAAADEARADAGVGAMPPMADEAGAMPAEEGPIPGEGEAEVTAESGDADPAMTDPSLAETGLAETGLAEPVELAPGPGPESVLALGDEQPYQTPPLPIGDREYVTGESETPIYTAEEIAVLQALAVRRDQLAEREAAVEARERQLAAAEARIDQKIVELTDLQARIEALLNDYDAQEDEQLMSLVRIYETMKPKDAAPIFNELEMDILLEIIARMSNIRSAPILARMDPARAQEVTEELARRMQERPDFMAEAPAAN
ncbi:MAG: hypothetical protein R3F55_19585 [Alphaproteobacteria bacterium]